MGAWLALGAAVPSPRPSPAIDPGTLIALAARAMQPDPAATPPATSEIRGRVAGDGFSGTFAEYRDGIRTRSEVRLGPLYLVTIGDGTHYWQSDENGDVRRLSGVLRRRAVTAEFVASGAYLRDPASLTYVGLERAASGPCYAFGVQAPGGDRQRICIDARTYRLSMREFEEAEGTATISYGEYRDVGGFEVAYRAVQRDAGSAHGVDFRAEAVSEGRPVEAARFALPTPRYADVRGGHTTVRLLRTRNGFEVPVTIGGRRLHFLLDSGSQAIVLDARTAQALHLPLRGRLRAVGASAVGGLALTHLDALSVGGATLRDLTVGVLGLSRATGGALSTDGVLGFPFFDAAVLRFDPHAATLEIEAPPDAAPPAGERLSVELDRQIPVIGAMLAGAGLVRLAVDTGSSAEVLLYAAFARDHPIFEQASLATSGGQAIGGPLAMRVVSLPQLTIGTMPLYDVRAGVLTQSQGAFGDRFDAGSIGIGVLRNFVVTFDDPAGAIYLRRGPDFDDGRFRPQYEPLGIPGIR